MASLGIGEALRREREQQGVSLDDISHNTRIPRRFLDAIEAEDFEGLPGLVFTRNFVRQYAEALRLDAEPMVEGLPKLDESNIQLPDPPRQKRKRTRYKGRSSGVADLVWCALAIAGAIVLYTHFNHADYDLTTKMRAAIAAFRGGESARSQSAEAAAAPDAPPEPSRNVASSTEMSRQVAGAADASSVEVVVTAVQQAWVELSADGKTSFTGMLMPNEKKEISAAEQVKIVAGNAGGLTVSLNGKPLEPLGPVGQVRVVRLTAEGPQFLPTSRQPSSDPAPL